MLTVDRAGRRICPSESLHYNLFYFYFLSKIHFSAIDADVIDQRSLVLPNITHDLLIHYSIKFQSLHMES